MDRRLTGFILLAVGAALLFWGLKENDSFGGSFTRAFTGSPTDKVKMLLISGGVLAAVGAYMAFFAKKKKKD